MKKVLGLIIFLVLATVLYAQTIEREPINYFPNYHPLVVHFPLVLLLAAAVMQTGLLFFQSKAYNYTVTIFTIVGFITALLAATVFHAHPASDVNPKAMEIFEAHEKLAFITIWISGFAAAFKTAGLFIHGKWVEIVSFLLLISCAATVSLAGHHGSELVYKQGIGPKGEKLEDEHKH